MKQLTKRLKQRFDFIFYDTIPINTFSEASILASEVDSSILVMSQTKSRRNTLEFSKKLLDDANSKAIGIIVNKAKKRYNKKCAQ